MESRKTALVPDIDEWLKKSYQKIGSHTSVFQATLTTNYLQSSPPISLILNFLHFFLFPYSFSLCFLVVFSPLLNFVSTTSVCRSSSKAEENISGVVRWNTPFYLRDRWGYFVFLCLWWWRCWCWCWRWCHAQGGCCDGARCFSSMRRQRASVCRKRTF